MDKNYFCLECNQPITQGVFNFSVQQLGIPLCMYHQDWINQMSEQSTFEAISLYFELKQRGVPAELEKFDGFKHIDLAISEAKINIEVDGGHHNYSYEQAMADLKRTYHSFKKGFYTVRIPNVLIHGRIQETADYIVGILNENLKRNYR
ncbi:MAG: DUF559 domain-containing protein [Paludibacter sp.]|nr:DUF559 domain-containing protein [Paludibacter sp.]